MALKKPYLEHLSRSSDLITPHEATRTGFLEMALEKNKAASPIVDQAKILKSVASKTKTPEELVGIDSIRKAIITAAGFSDKASKYILPEDQNEIVTEFIKNFLIPAKTAYVDELVYRFLLTKGDSIGGSLRNLVGKLAKRKLTATFISALDLFKLDYHILTSYNKKKDWVARADYQRGQEDRVSCISWDIKGRKRTLVINYTVPAVGKNVDLCLLDSNYDQVEMIIEKSPQSYMALGELKGGIDPAGADEHWKTARSAFTRIRTAFSIAENFPDTFFIGAAIEKSMADEIWNMLETNLLTNAANLTDTDQLSSIITWLINK